jgi:hypothetical protein
MTPSGIEPATFRFVAQYLNHCATVSGPLFTIVISANVTYFCFNSKYNTENLRKDSSQPQGLECFKIPLCVTYIRITSATKLRGDSAYFIA